MGLAKVDPWTTVGNADTSYYHTDMIGTTRFMTDSIGHDIGSAVYTAFGERISGTQHRYGYTGAWGYQTHDDVPFLHVGHRYYDPVTGRFLQRDPIGIAGDLNSYEYVRGRPLNFIDPSGLRTDMGWDRPPGGYPRPPHAGRPNPTRGRPPIVAKIIIAITGGEESWLDDPGKVKKAKKYLYMTSLVCASAASGLPLAVRVGAGVAGGAANIYW